MSWRTGKHVKGPDQQRRPRWERPHRRRVHCSTLPNHCHSHRYSRATSGQWKYGLIYWPFDQRHCHHLDNRPPSPTMWSPSRPSSFGLMCFKTISSGNLHFSMHIQNPKPTIFQNPIANRADNSKYLLKSQLFRESWRSQRGFWHTRSSVRYIHTERGHSCATIVLNEQNSSLPHLFNIFKTCCFFCSIKRQFTFASLDLGFFWLFLIYFYLFCFVCLFSFICF